MTLKARPSECTLTSGLSRAVLRARLAAPRGARRGGDAATAARLIEAGSVEPSDRGQVSTILMPGTFYRHAGQEAEPSIPAAVLIPLIEHSWGFSVLFTQRTPDLKAHAGQISFPGGRLESSDADARAGALRETVEEIGLAASQIEILGQLDPYMTVTGYEITPVVGAVTPPLELKPDPLEVAEIFEVPLAFLLDPGNHQRHSRVVAEGVRRAYYALPYGDRYIWGATAGMLVNLYEVLTARAEET